MRAEFLRAMRRGLQHADERALRFAIQHGDGQAAVGAVNWMEVEVDLSQMFDSDKIGPLAGAASRLANLAVPDEARVGNPEQLTRTALDTVQHEAGRRVRRIGDETRRGLRALVETGFSENMDAAEMERRVASMLRADGGFGLDERSAAAIARREAAMNQAGVTRRDRDRIVHKLKLEALQRRARLVAHTELQDLGNDAMLATWRAAAREAGPGVHFFKVWRTRGPSACPRCDALNGQRRRLEEAFSGLAGDTPMRPLLHPHCYCWLDLESSEDPENEDPTYTGSDSRRVGFRPSLATTPPRAAVSPAVREQNRMMAAARVRVQEVAQQRRERMRDLNARQRAAAAPPAATTRRRAQTGRTAGGAGAATPPARLGAPTASPAVAEAEARAALDAEIIAAEREVRDASRDSSANRGPRLRSASDRLRQLRDERDAMDLAKAAAVISPKATAPKIENALKPAKELIAEAKKRGMDRYKIPAGEPLSAVISDKQKKLSKLVSGGYATVDIDGTFVEQKKVDVAEMMIRSVEAASRAGIDVTAARFEPGWSGGDAVMNLQLRDRKTGDTGSVTRQFHMERGKFTVEHDFFRSPTEGDGFGKELFKELFDFYHASGVDVVKVHANIDVGGYAWGRYGFLPDAPSWRTIQRYMENGLRDLLAEGSITQRTHDELLKVSRRSDPRTLWELVDAKVGFDGPSKGSIAAHVGGKRTSPVKAILARDWIDWYGSIDLHNEEQMARVHSYLESGKKK